MTTAVSIELKKFGEEFNGRLSKDDLNYALSYINFGEESLAFEILCDYICENNLSLTKNEYEHICSLNTLFNDFLERDVIMYLKALIK
ncbi:MafI family immunity protein [Enterobacter sp. C2]|uniref:MafI family immunity protein n=1 Tax=Enterobacter sp. C2 TaxID=2870346 RepID=UPI001CA3A183|nr:MafI family immunity protein [Enterobacter sp. C2]